MSGFKVFPASTVLASADVNSYLMQQANIICTSSTRPTPINGMQITETDTQRTYKHNGTAWIYQYGGLPLYAARVHLAAPYTNVHDVNGTVAFDTEDYDYNGNQTTGGAATYTVPVTGLYQVNTSLTYLWANAQRQIGTLGLYRNAAMVHQVGDSEYSPGSSGLSASVDPKGLGFSDAWPFTAGEAVTIKLLTAGVSNVSVIVSNAFFSIHKV